MLSLTRGFILWICGPATCARWSGLLADGGRYYALVVAHVLSDHILLTLCFSDEELRA